MSSLKKIYIVSNGVSRAKFTKTAIDNMKMLNLIQFRGTRITPDGTVYNYTASFDNRRVVV